MGCGAPLHIEAIVHSGLENSEEKVVGMLGYRLLQLSFLLPVAANAQSLSVTSALILSGTNAASTRSVGGDGLPTGTQVSYVSYSSTIIVSSSSTTSGSQHGSMTDVSTNMAAANVSGSSSSIFHSTSPSVTLLTGAVKSTTSSILLNGTAKANATVTANLTTSTTSSAQPVNTQPCNNYPEFCTRRYGNITEVAAHNSPFVKPGSAASNQQLGVIAQLNDGIRMRTSCKPTVF